MGLTDLWASLVDCIVRPPRDIYVVEDLVGGASGQILGINMQGTRNDLVLTNKKGQVLQCSHFVPSDARGKGNYAGRLPCVLYLHCNSGSRRDAEEAVYVLLPLGVSVFTLDFAGSGLSDGQYVTLGANEVDDVEVVVNHLRSTNQVSTLGLWGRSMGAVTALLYSQRDPSIAGVVIDSPFSRLTDLMMEIVEEQKLPIPRPFFKLAVSAMKRSVRKKAGFDLDKVAPIDAVPSSFIPVLFGHATGDTFIKIAHSEKLHAAYAGDKNLIKFEGDHNSRRPEFFFSSVSVFFHNVLQLDNVLEGGNPLDREVRRVLQVLSSPPAPPRASGAAAAPAGPVADASNGGPPPAQSPSGDRPRDGPGVRDVSRSLLDTWGDRARADLSQAMLGDEAFESELLSGDEDPEEQEELMKAIQLSLLETARQQQQAAAGAAAAGAAAAAPATPAASTQSGLFPQQSPALQQPPPPVVLGVPGAVALLRPAAPASAAGTAGAASGAGPAPAQQQQPGASSVVAAAAQPVRNGWDRALLVSRPTTAEEEEAQLREALRLSLGDVGGAAAQPAPAAEVGGTAVWPAPTAEVKSSAAPAVGGKEELGAAGASSHAAIAAASPAAAAHPAAAAVAPLPLASITPPTSGAMPSANGIVAGIVAAGAAAAPAAEATTVPSGSQRAASYVDQLCDELAQGLTVQQQPAASGGISGAKRGHKEG